MLDWMVSWQRDTATMRNDAAMIVACGTWRTGFDPSLELSADDLAAITAPCLVLAGSNDPVGGMEVAEQLAAALPSGMADCLPDAGHLPWLDDPGWVADHAGDFLAQAPRPSTRPSETREQLTDGVTGDPRPRPAG
jgi:pimeloyl-ACP methyl ester carboxylesterase